MAQAENLLIIGKAMGELPISLSIKMCRQNKTPAAESKTWLPQIAAYAHLASSNGFDVRKGLVVRLPKDENTRKVGDFIKAKRGRNGGTWFHPELAIHFARRLDVRFSIWSEWQESLRCFLFPKVMELI